MSLPLYFFAGLFLSLGSISWGSPVATIDDQQILSESLKEVYSGLPENQKLAINRDPLLKRELVEQSLATELFYKEAQKAKVADAEDVKIQIENAKKNVVVTRYLQSLLQSKMTPSALKEYFQKNSVKYGTQQVRALHIVVNTQKEAQDLLPKVEQAKTPEDFAKLARHYSTDPTVQNNGGDLGFFQREKMVREFSDVVFAMRRGETKGPIHTIYGYHIARVLDFKTGRVPHYEEVEARVREDYRTEFVKKLFSQLKAQHRVEIKDGEVQKLKI